MAQPKQVVHQSPLVNFDPILVVEIWIIKQIKLGYTTLERQSYDEWRKRAGIKFANSRWLVERNSGWNNVLDVACQDLGIVNPITGLCTVSVEKIDQ